jgi:hypothetical protein
VEVGAQQAPRVEAQLEKFADLLEETCERLAVGVIEEHEDATRPAAGDVEVAVREM